MKSPNTSLTHASGSFKLSFDPMNAPMI
ncbi:MAG: hypothetical protein RLZZ289_1226, partial [Bacteroidota bacterium]